MTIPASKSSQTPLKTWFWANFRQITIFENHDFQKSVEKLWKRVKSEYFLARNPIFTTLGAENRTRGDFLKIGRPADDAARQVGGTGRQAF